MMIVMSGEPSINEPLTHSVEYQLDTREKNATDELASFR